MPLRLTLETQMVPVGRMAFYSNYSFCFQLFSLCRFNPIFSLSTTASHNNCVPTCFTQQLATPFVVTDIFIDVVAYSLSCFCLFFFLQNECGPLKAPTQNYWDARRFSVRSDIDGASLSKP